MRILLNMSKCLANEMKKKIKKNTGSPLALCTFLDLEIDPPRAIYILYLPYNSKL